jgi:hypothetical protein
MKGTLFLQSECETIAGVSQLTKYMKSELKGFDITYGQPNYGSEIKSLLPITPDDVKWFDRVIISPIMVSYMRDGEVPYVPYIEACAENQIPLVFMIHGSVQGISDDAWSKLEHAIDIYTCNNVLQIWYVCNEYAESYKRRLPEDILLDIEFKYCPFTSLGIRSISKLAKKYDPIETKSTVFAMITRDTTNRVARFFDQLPEYNRFSYNIICGHNGEFSHKLSLNTHYYLNLTDDAIKYRILNDSLYYVSGSFYDDGLHIKDHIENGYDWSLIEAICSGCRVITTPEFHTRFINDGIKVIEYDKTNEFKDILTAARDESITSLELANNIKQLLKRYKHDIKIIKELFKS